MSIQMIGIDHTRAGIDVRTVFSFTKKKMAEALAVLQKVPGIEGCVLISTCNRMELWASTDDGFPEEGLYEQLCKIKEADTGDVPSVFCISQRAGGGAAPLLAGRRTEVADSW